MDNCISNSNLINENNDKITGKDWLKYSISIWDDIKTSKEKQYRHPASFPITMVDKLIRIYSKSNNLILDPFMGTGSTLVAASEANRNSIGFDINKEYIDLTCYRLANYNDKFKIINDSCCNLDQYLMPESVDLCITSPLDTTTYLSKRQIKKCIVNVFCNLYLNSSASFLLTSAAYSPANQYHY